MLLRRNDSTGWRITSGKRIGRMVGFVGSPLAGDFHAAIARQRASYTTLTAIALWKRSDWLVL